MNKFFILFVGLLLFYSCSKQPEWGKSRDYLIPLTYPDAEWNSEDFGRETTPEEQLLLRKILPQVFVTTGELLPLDFYQEYLPQTVLKDWQGDIVSKGISREKLKKVERQAGYYLDYQGKEIKCYLPSCSKRKSKIYGRVFYETLSPPQKYAGEKPIKFKILKYNLVFSASGMPKILQWHKNVFVSLLGDKENWHELDIHGAIHLLVEEKSEKIYALLLAQHNHFRTYVLGKDIKLGENGKLQICIAQRSNEPYPCPRVEQRFRTVGNPSRFSFVLGGSQPIFDGGYDLVPARDKLVNLNLELEFLPDRDPLYTSWIQLGDKQKIMGIIPSFFRSGPPGININTSPKIKGYTDITKIWYFSENDPKQIELFSQMGGFFDPNVAPLLEYNGTRLWEAFQQIH